MTESLDAIRKLVEECSDEDRQALKQYLRKVMPHPLESEWGIDADTILSAIKRSSDLTKRGVRGIIAEAVFVDRVIPTVSGYGWEWVDFQGDHPYDALLQKGELKARIQVKLQRLEEREPKLYYPRHYEKGAFFVVEVQKTRTGVKTTKKSIPGGDTMLTAAAAVTVKTRPYAFGDFDILAVNMHPSTKNWNDFRYTVASWLLPRPANPALIEIFQPVASRPNEVWTNDLATCLNWLESGKQNRILSELLHLKTKKEKTGREKNKRDRKLEKHG
jgi:hypothetical protein